MFQPDHAEFLLRFAFTQTWQLRRVLDRLRAAYPDNHPVVVETQRAYEAAVVWVTECYRTRQGCWGVSHVDEANVRQQLQAKVNSWELVALKRFKRGK